jgi:hypothetical protein
VITASASRVRVSDREENAVIDKSMDALTWLRKQLETDENDLLREMVRSFAEGLMSADADAACGAGYGEVSADRTNRRNGYRSRRWDTRVGSIELKIPKLRTSSYFPDWLLDARTRSERAFIQVVAEAYVRGRIHPSGRRAGRDARDRFALEVPGIGVGQRSRRDGRSTSGTGPSTKARTPMCGPTP